LVDNLAVSVEHWEAVSDVANVAAIRRGVALAVSEVLTNVVLHGGAADTVITTAELVDGDFVVAVRGAGFGLSHDVNGPAVRLGMVIAAALAGNLRVASSDRAGRHISMRFPLAPPVLV
jgi:anti-sigma regulatory factor (Ser/Thr protein kinase)